MRFLILIFLITTSLFAININNSLLRIHATLVPKLYLMDYEYKSKVKNDTIVIDILYDKANYKSALALKNKFYTKYKNGLESYKLKVELVLYSNIDRSDANIYYLFPSKSTNIKKAVKQASNNNALTFSYLKDDLKYGVMVSLAIGIKVKPVLNLDAIKRYHISFRPILLNISTIYTTKQSSYFITKMKVRFT